MFFKPHFVFGREIRISFLKPRAFGFAVLISQMAQKAVALNSLYHQILSAQQAKDCYIVVLVQYAKGTQYLVEGGTTCCYVINDQDIVLVD